MSTFRSLRIFASLIVTMDHMHRRVNVSLLASLFCLLAACSSPLSTHEIIALGEAEARWAERPFQAYTYEIVTSCGLCPYAMMRLTRVAVSNGTVIGGVVVANDSALGAGDLSSFTTIDGLFAQIEREQGEDWVRDIRVTYDSHLGYPTSISVFARDGIMDAGASQFIRNLVPTP